MAEGEKARFVNLSSKSWADEEGDAPAPAKSEAPKTWGKVETPTSYVSIADQMKEEEGARKDQGGREGFQSRGGHGGGHGGGRGGGHGGHGGERPSGGGGRHHEDGDRPREPRPPRERAPIPDHPPYTAFFGNLSYEVDEQAISDYFGELGVANVRVMRDMDGRPKGFAYVEFTTREGLENALSAHEMDFHGRRLNIDVAAPKKDDRFGGGRGGRGGYGDRSFGSGGFGDRGFGGGDRYGGGGRGGYGGGGFRRDDGPAERPKLNLAPRTKPVDGDKPAAAAPSPAASAAGDAPAKPAGDDPFGAAKTDIEKMNAIAGERLKKEQEREARLAAEKKALEERRLRDREERDRAPRGGFRGGRGGDRDGPRPERSAPPPTVADQKDSWRRKDGDAPKFSSRGGFGGGRGGREEGGQRGGRGGGRGGHSAWQQDDEGFRSRDGPKKEGGAKAAAGGVAPAAGGVKDGDAANPYGALDE